MSEPIQPAAQESMVTIVDHPVISDKLAHLRNEATTSEQFRRLLRQISAMLVWPATQHLSTESVPVSTPLAVTEGAVLASEVVVVSILRAGNGMLDGFLDVLPGAKVGFVGLFRNEETLQPVRYYSKFPDGMAGASVLLVDPMLATANSAVAAVDLLHAAGARDVVLVVAVAAPEGLANLTASHPDVRVVVAALDSGLDDNGYILPGLGDAGDRIFGT